MSKDHEVKAYLNEKKLKSVTLFGAVGLALNEPVYMMGNATSIDELKRFIPYLATKVRNRPLDFIRRPWTR